jgi:4-amino-4-deoxy-L-arabinose transferase-like glycosyltransferase
MLHLSRFAWVYLLGAILFIYMSLSYYQLNLPGLHYDEAFEAVPALQLLRGQPVAAFRNSGLMINNQIFPFMTQDYIGAINTYIALPFIAVFGSTPIALRMMSILVGAITLGLTYLLAAQLSGSRGAGLAAALLLSVDPTFIFWNRQGIFVTAVTAPIGLAATLCWLHRLQGGSRRWTAAGAFFFGLGLYAKLLFLWLIAALLGAILLISLPGWLKRRSLPGVGRGSPVNLMTEIFVALLAFTGGCWALLVYNLQTGGTFLNILQNATTSYYGVNNLAFGPNLFERMGQFVTLLSGSHLWYLGNVVSNPLPVLAFGLSLVAMIGVGFKSTSPPENNSTHYSPLQKALFPFLVIGLVILASIGTVSALWITHFAILMPWPAIALAVGGTFIKAQVAGSRWQVAGSKVASGKVAGSRVADFTHYVSRFTPHRLIASRFIFAAALGLLVVTNLAAVIRYHLALTESGGLSAHSAAIYEMSNWLVQHAHGPVVAMDWGLAAPVTYLTNTQVTPTEVFGYIWNPDTELMARLNKFIAQPETFYLWRAPDEIIFDRSPEFKALYRPHELEETIEAAFYEYSGRPILGITRLVPKGTAENPPK